MQLALLGDMMMYHEWLIISIIEQQYMTLWQSIEMCSIYKYYMYGVK